MVVDLFEHNRDAFGKIEKALADGKKKFAISHATGTGKSYVIAKLSEKFNQEKKLILLPSRYIKEQMEGLFNKYGIGNTNFLLYQKLIKMNDDEISKLNYQLIVLDEYHHDTARVWGNKVKYLMNSHPDSVIFGTSATHIRCDGVNVIDELFEGNCISELPLSQAIAKKVVPIPRYVAALYTLDDELDNLMEKVRTSTNTKEEKEEFMEKIKAMRSQIEKSYGMPIILNRYVKDRSGKYIVFCKNKKHLNDIQDIAVEWFKTAGFKDIHTYTVHSSYEMKDREYGAFCDDKSSALKLLFCVNMLNEGLHLEDISGVLMLRPTNSNIIWHQQIGRCIESNNSSNPIIIDAVNNFSSVGQGVQLLKDIKDAVRKEKEGSKDFDDSDFLDIDTFFVTEYVLDVEQMFKEIEGRLADGWDVYIKALEQYKEREGNCLVPGKHVEVLKDGTKLNLGCWVGHMRCSKTGIRGYLLTPKREQQLEEIGFIWNVREYSVNYGISELTKYKEEFGNCKVPQKFITRDGYKLGSFVSILRQNGYILYENEVKILNELGFIWNEKDYNFNEWIKLLTEYKEKYGFHNITNTTIYKGRNIGRFLTNIKRSKNISPEKKAQLIKIGVDFTKSNFDVRFIRHYEILKEYCLMGKKVKRRTIYKNVRIGEWLYKQPARYRNGCMNVAQYNLLLELGIDVKTLCHKKIKNKIMGIEILKNGKTIGDVKTYSEAVAFIKQNYNISISKSSISLICLGKQKESKGFVFRRKDCCTFQYADTTDQSELVYTEAQSFTTTEKCCC